MDMDNFTSDEREKEFNDWLQSITLIGEDGQPADMELEPDESDDPEGDRGDDE